MKRKGISLIALIITISVIIILSAAVILTTTDASPIQIAKKSKFFSDLEIIEEEIDLFCANNGDLEKGNNIPKSSIWAGKNYIDYKNIKEEDKVNKNIVDVSKTAKKYMDLLEIEEGKIIISANASKKETKWAQEAGYEISKFSFDENNVLLATNNNLELLTEDGILRIPRKATGIKSGAFSILPGVKKIIIPGTVKVIGANAFYGNTSLEEVVLEEGIEQIETYAFNGCISLKSVDMPNSITTLGGAIFSGCINLVNVKLSNNLKVISNNLFRNCVKLRQIDIPNSVIKIDPYSFCNTSLENLYISENVTSIASNAFSGCTRLIMLAIAEGNPVYKMEGNTWFDKQTGDIIQIFNATNILEYDIPNGVKTISESVFNGCTNIRKITIPESVTNININSLLNKKNLSSVIVDENNQNFYTDEGALYSKDQKTLIFCFYQGTVYNIKEGVEKIKEDAFRGKLNLISVILSNSLKSIGIRAFYECTNIQEIYIKENVNGLSGLSFYAFDLKRVKIDPANKNYIIENGVLYNYDKTTLIDVDTDYTSFEIPSGVITISDYAFHGNRKLASVTIPDTVVSIGNSFGSCLNLEVIEIPESVTSIGSDCFGENTKLSKIIVNRTKGAIKGAPWGCPKSEDRVVEWVGEN